jgi:hypothetical protein
VRMVGSFERVSDLCAGRGGGFAGGPTRHDNVWQRLLRGGRPWCRRWLGAGWVEACAIESAWDERLEPPAERNLDQSLNSLPSS